MQHFMTDIHRLNSMTKYPPILTYHTMGDRGVLGDDLLVSFGPNEDVIVTEKIHGVNGRIVILPDGDWVIGSREELLTARGDRIPNPMLRIVEAMAPLAEEMLTTLHNPDAIVVLFGEVYGGGTSDAWKQYGTREALGVLFFDMIVLDVDVASQVYRMPREKIALWREHGNQPFASELALSGIGYPITPRVARLNGGDIPTKLESMPDWLSDFVPHTYAALDSDGLMGAEGVVVRTADRSKIAKIRYEDYQRTMRARTKGGK